ncbi:MAG: multicopper oxidase family protein [Formosimonas sp.]
MNRRQFLTNSFYTTIALSLNACGKSQTHEAMTGMNTSATRLNPKNIISGEPLRPPAKLTGAVLNIAPAQAHWLADGTPSEVWAYDGGGGSLIELMEGETLRLTVNNQLPEPTTVHWHGVDVPSDQDGHPHHAINSKDSRVYEFIAPDAGTYWYHPHPHKRASIQAARGLAAPLIVRAADDPLAALGIAEHVLLFTAPQLDEHGQIAPHNMDEQMNGRDGNLLLVNGQHQPVLSVPAGATQRLRLINASNARYLRLSFEHADMVQVGSDGGLLTAPLPAQRELLLAPAERVEVCVAFTQASTLKALPYDKGWMSDGMGSQKPTPQTIDVLRVEPTGQAVAATPLPKQLRSIAPLGEAKITRQLILTEKMEMSMAGGQHNMTMDFMINGQKFDMSRTDFTARAGEVELWEIVNQTDMDHPFHIHGSHFQVQDAPYLAWKDTVNTRAGQTVRLKIAQKHAGLRMFHCHILEHEDLGMMGQYEVKP